MNQEIEVKLDYRDIAGIQVCVSDYLHRHTACDSEFKDRMLAMSAMLGEALMAHPDNDKPNSH